MVIIVTGAIGSGKTTVCQKVVAMARTKGWQCGGVVSYKTPDGGIVVEDVQSGRTMLLASLADECSGPRTGKYSFRPAGIAFGNDALAKGAGFSLLVVDEVGPLELKGEGFASAIELVRAGKTSHSLMVIRTELLPEFLPRLGVPPAGLRDDAGQS